MTLISLVCLFALSSTVFSRSVVSPSMGYGSTRVNPPTVSYGYESTRSNPPPSVSYGSTRVNPPTVSYGYESTRSNPPPTVSYGYGSSRSNPTTMTRSLPSNNLNAALQSAVSELDRQSLLADDQFIFDFFNSATGISEGLGGRTVAATANNFPALIGHGVAMTLGFIGPCGINLPHTHPRATEINFAVSGTFQAGLFQENQARFIMNVLDSGKVTVFPQGAVHFEQNLACEPATFVAAFNSADPGVQTVADAFFGGLPADIVGASLGGLNITTVEALKAMLPRNAALGIDECRQRCGL